MQGEETQVRPVEDPRLLIFESVGNEKPEWPQVPEVGETHNEDALWVEEPAKSTKDCPGIARVLEDVGADDAIEVAVGRRDRAGLDVSDENPVEPGARDLRGPFRPLDPPRLGDLQAILGGSRRGARATTDVEKPPGPSRNQRQDVLANEIEVLGGFVGVQGWARHLPLGRRVHVAPRPRSPPGPHQASGAVYHAA